MARTSNRNSRFKGFRVFGLCALLLILVSPAQAQLDACGQYDVDGVPGFDIKDFMYSVGDWGEGAGSTSDFDGNGQVNILDLLNQMACDPGEILNPGLIGLYYGMDEGYEDQDIDFPNMQSLASQRDPVVVRVTEKLERIEGYRGFMDSDMRRNFGAVYKGFLYVPETATYTLNIWGYKGMRVFLDNTMILEYDSWPREDTTTLQLQEGTHPLYIEFYSGMYTPRILFTWSSNGQVIGPQAQTIDQRYLYHNAEQVPDYAGTALELAFDPPSGTRVTAGAMNLDAFVMSPDMNVTLAGEGMGYLPLSNGVASRQLSLSPGLNRFMFTAQDGSGREIEVPYHVYRDSESLTANGLAANLYATEWYSSQLPGTEGLLLFGHAAHAGTQMEENGNSEIYAGAKFLERGSIAVLEGTLQISQSRTYYFYSGTTSALSINGEFVGGINAQYPNQWSPSGEVFLEAGRHHYKLVVSNPWRGPEAWVRWRVDEEADWTEIPNHVFQHGPQHYHSGLNWSHQATGGRVASGILAEYLFQPGDPLADTSGNGFDLRPDPRAFFRGSGGVTFETAGGLNQEQGAVRMNAEIQRTRAFSLEIEFIYEGPVQNWNWRPLASLSGTNWQSRVELMVNHDNIFFRLRNDAGDTIRVDAPDVVETGKRLHVVATWDGSTARLFVDGNLMDSEPAPYSIEKWGSLAHFNIAQGYRRFQEPSTFDSQLYGTVLGVAMYNRALSQQEIQTNRNVNLGMLPNPGPMSAPQVTAFPPAGTTAGELDEAHHILNRLSFGPSPDSLAEVINTGVDTWINKQLNPASIDDSEVEDFLASGLIDPDKSYYDLPAYGLFRATHSKRQLLEVMTQFWENHFNTQASKVDNAVEEMAENDRFREHALGNFRDLLLASALHVPMVVYLDNVLNVVGAPNENYGREIFELHCLGANNGYTQDDIVEAARCFTGWSVKEGRFHFDAGYHDYGEKNLLGMTIPAGGGLQDGMMLIDHLMEMPETARFISWKLCQLLVDDEPPEDVVDAASAAFSASNGDITEVLLAIVNHNRFRNDPTYCNNKTRTPYEYLAALTRLTESHPMAATMAESMAAMGMELFQYPDPTGFEEAGFAWIDSNTMLARWNVANQIACNRGNGMTTGVNMSRFIAKRGLQTSDDVLDFFEAITTHGTEAPGVRAIMENYMTGGDPGAFQLNEETIDEAVRRTLSLYLRLPEMNKQ